MRNQWPIHPNHTWLVILLPALFYHAFLSPAKTPLLSYSYRPLYTSIIFEQGTGEETGNLLEKTDVFEEVVFDKDASFHDMIWVEDVGLGRGYLLLSDNASSGKVWRYEIGGGLIPIGKSLYLDKAGCRSGHWTRCDVEKNSGSRGLAVQVMKDEDRFDIGKLLIVEGGERRIVRLEEDGARTPLVLEIPDICGGSNRRLNYPSRLLYTPFGDLLFLDTTECRDGADAFNVSKSSIYRVRDVVNVPQISFFQSRSAHSWTMRDMIKNQSEVPVELSYTGMEQISDMIVGKDLTSLFVAGRFSSEKEGCRQVIVKAPDDTESTAVQNISDMTVFFDMTNFFPHRHCGEGDISMAIDNEGNIFATHSRGFAIINADGNLLANVEVSPPFVEHDSFTRTFRPNGIVIGNDGYLYMTTKERLLRMRVKSKLLDYPTNLIVPKSK